MTRSKQGGANLPSGSGNDETEELINKVCSKFCNTIEEKMYRKLDSIESKINNMQTSLRQLAADNQKSVQEINVRVDQLEQFSKRNCLRFVGVQCSDNENLCDKILGIITTQLNILCQENDIDSVVHLRNSNNQKQSDTVLVQFVTNFKRNEVLSARKYLKRSNISIYEDLTKSRYDLLMSAKKKYGGKRAWSLGGKIFVWLEQEAKKKIVYSEEDL